MNRLAVIITGLLVAFAGLAGKSARIATQDSALEDSVSTVRNSKPSLAQFEVKGETQQSLAQKDCPDNAELTVQGACLYTPFAFKDFRR